MLTRQAAGAGNFAMCSQTCSDGELYYFAVKDRQYSGITRAHRTSVVVRGLAKFGGASAENLRLSQDLGMDLETYDSFELHR